MSPVGNDTARRTDDGDVESTTVTVPAPRRASAPTVPAPRPAPVRTAAPTTPTTPTTPAAPRVRPGWTELAVAAAAYVGLLVALAVRVRSTAPLCLRAAPPAMLLAGVALGLGTWLLARGLAASWSDLGGSLPPAQPGLWTFSGAAPTVAIVLLVGLVVPCLEELLFRGVVVAALGRYGVVAAAAGSAVLFGAAHGLTFVVIAAVALGAVNAVMVWRLRSIWPGVVAHATFNLVSIGMTLALS